MYTEMGINMKDDFFEQFSINTSYIVLGLAVITIITFIIAIIALVKAGKMKKKYNMFINGASSENIEQIIKDNIDELKSLKQTVEENKKYVKDIYDKMQYSFQKIGIIKYDAFYEMGGKLSFALCMLDKNNNGYVVNVMHSNTGCFAYIKEIVKGQSYVELGDEEKKALEQAIAGPNGDAQLGKKVNDIIESGDN